MRSAALFTLLFVFVVLFIACALQRRSTVACAPNSSTTDKSVTTVEPPSWPPPGCWPDGIYAPWVPFKLRNYVDFLAPSLTTATELPSILLLGDSTDRKLVSSWSAHQKVPIKVACEENLQCATSKVANLCSFFIPGAHLTGPFYHELDESQSAINRWNANLACIMEQAPFSLFVLNMNFWDLARLFHQGSRAGEEFSHSWLESHIENTTVIIKHMISTLQAKWPAARVGIRTANPVVNRGDWKNNTRVAMVNSSNRAAAQRASIPLFDVEKCLISFPPHNVTYDGYHPDPRLRPHLINILLNFAVHLMSNSDASIWR